MLEVVHLRYQVEHALGLCGRELELQGLVVVFGFAVFDRPAFVHRDFLEGRRAVRERLGEDEVRIVTGKKRALNEHCSSEEQN